MEERKQSVRIQTSILNAAEKKLLVWIAERLPRRMTSNHLTFIGMFGALVVALGYALSTRDIQWLWLASFGFVINWFGDSLDGSVARVRGEQRPVGRRCILLRIARALDPLVQAHRLHPLRRPAWRARFLENRFSGIGSMRSTDSRPAPGSSLVSSRSRLAQNGLPVSTRSSAAPAPR